MATRGKGVRIPLAFDKTQADKDAREFAGDLKSSLTPVVDVVELVKTGYEKIASGIKELVGFAKEAISAASEQEQAELKLTAALERRGKASAGFIDKLNAENFARQQTLAISDDMQMNLQAQMLLMDVDAEHVSKLTEATIGLSETTGKDLNGSLQTVVKAYHGNIAGLKKLGIEARDAESAIDALASKADVARVRANSFQGSIDRLTENISEFWEELGNAVVRNEDVKELLADANHFVLEMIDVVKNDGPEFKSFVSDLVQNLRDLSTWAKENKEDIKLVIQLLAFGAGARMGTGLVSLGAAALGGLGGWGGKLLASGGSAIGGMSGIGILGSAAALTAGSVMLIPDTNSDAVAEALKRDMGVVDKKSMAGTGRNFDPTMIRRLTDQPDVEFDIGSKVTVDLTKKKADDKKAAEKEAREYAAAEKKMLDDEAKAYAKYVADMASLDKEFNAAHAIARREMLDQEGEAIRWETEQINERTRIRLHGFLTIEELQKAEAKSQKEFFIDLGQTAVLGTANFLGNWLGGLAGGAGKVKNAGREVFGALLGIAGDAMITIGAAITAAGFGSTAVPFLIPIFGGPAGVVAGGLITAAGGVLKGWGGGIASSSREAVRQGTAVGPSAGFDPGTFRQSEIPNASPSGSARQTIVNIILPDGMLVGSTDELARTVVDLLGGHAELQFGG